MCSKQGNFMALKPEEHIFLREYTTFKIGGEAKYFFRAKSIEDVREAVGFAHENSFPIFVLGGGSNLLVSDLGFQGVVIKNEILGLEFIEEGDFVLAKAGAGENWDSFVDACVSRELYGLENLSGIPGTVGATPVQNIGAYGVEVKDTIFSVETLDTRDGGIKIFENKDCHFAYRDSFFKTKEGKNFVVLSVTFKLRKTGKLNLEYKDLANYFSGKAETATLKTVRNAVLEIRSKKFPDLKIFGTAGSFFKNPIISNESFEKIKKDYPEIPNFPANQGGIDKSLVKVSLAWILDKVCGLKGFSEGPVGLYEFQPIVIVNNGGANSQQVENFAVNIAQKVFDKTGIKVAWEVEKL
jgi:UDP-N-acetylmuramate dehydrogenase